MSKVIINKEDHKTNRLHFSRITIFFVVVVLFFTFIYYIYNTLIIRRKKWERQNAHTKKKMGYDEQKKNEYINISG